jgi:hypothetical protein
MGTSCKESAQALIDCMKKTKCMKEGGDFKTCLKSAKENDDCQVWPHNCFQCNISLEFLGCAECLFFMQKKYAGYEISNSRAPSVLNVAITNLKDQVVTEESSLWLPIW